MLARTVRDAAARFGDLPVLVEPGRSTSYRELHAGSDRAAAALAGLGVGEGSVVALTLPSGRDYLVAYAAAAALGAATAGINPSLTDAERARLLEHLAPDLVVDDPAMLGVGGGDTTPSDASPDPPPALRPDPERLVAIVFTSGTTGLPKGAVFRERQLRAVCDIDLGPGWEDRWGGGGPILSSTQFAHVGFMTKLPWYLRTGITIVALERWRADDVLRAIAEHRISTLGVVAPQLALLLRSPLVDELDLSCVTAIVAGGAASPPGLVRAARERFGATYSIRYSSTESGGVGLATAFDAPEEEALHTVGRPRPGVEVRVAREDGSPAPAGEVGELQLRSPAMFDGYWRDPDATAAAIVDGWYRTGDLASIDAGGLVRLCGRSKEMYIRGGYNVAPAEVEQVLSEHPDVASVAVAPRPDDVMGEIGVAVVVAAPGRAPSLDDLREFAADRLARWKLPEALVVVDDLPLTASQKLDRSALARLVVPADGGVGGVASVDGDSDRGPQ